MKTSRRAFVLSGAAMAASNAFSFASKEQQIAVRTDSEIGAIRPELHGHFAEHLGSCIYGGLWQKKTFNQKAIDYLRQVGVPVLRWPGGCFADDYHWRDGIGPAAKRPKRVNIHWGSYVEDNSFGTHEFMELCRRIGAQPYFAGNVGSGTPEELRDWVEYCNYPSGSTLSGERAANGSPEPFRIRYWGVGNENWGCGGQMTAQEYAGHYRRYASYVRPFADTTPFLIACGPNNNNADWTRGFFDSMQGRSRRPNGFSMHFYSRGNGIPTKFTVEAMREQLSSFSSMEQAVVEQRSLMDKYDPQRRVGLMIDEWGVWDRMVPDEEKRYGRLFQQITMRGAVAAALGLNVFHRQADKLVMCNIAQIVNVLHSLLLIDGDHCVRTTTYHAFDLLKEHREKTAVRVDTGDPSPLGLSVSASRRDKTLVLTCVNPQHDSSISVNASLGGAGAVSGKARILHDPDLNAANTFDNPDCVVPRDHRIDVSGAKVRIEMPPLSIVTAILSLA